jgi:hypothetical protein
MTTTDTTTMPAACHTRADTIRGWFADRCGTDALALTTRDGDLSVLAYRIGWDAPAAGEYPRPMLADAYALAAVRPDLSDRVWHHVAGATILGGYCCGTPASHRDALVALARELRTEPAPA